MSKSLNAASRNAKGPFKATMFGYQFGGPPSKNAIGTVTEARKWAEGFRNEAHTCIIYDRTGKPCGSHVRGVNGWERGQ